MIRTGTTQQFYYTYTDHLGSVQELIQTNGTIAESYSFDAWGRRRNPTNWSYTNISNPTILTRGFTGHEHLDEFGLINMNARLYDPFVGRMLGPDNLVVDPFNAQHYNRYSYVWNNPLKWIDPTGNAGKPINPVNVKIPVRVTTQWSQEYSTNEYVVTANRGVNYNVYASWLQQPAGGATGGYGSSGGSGGPSGMGKVGAQGGGIVVVDNSLQATKHYLYGKGSPVRIGSTTTKLLLNSPEFIKAHRGIINGQSKKSGIFKVNMTKKVFHIGRTNVSYLIGPKGNSVTYKLYDGDGFWDPDFIDEKYLGPISPNFRPDGPGPNLERLGGTPYYYIPTIITFPF